MMEMDVNFDILKFDEKGFIPAIAQDHLTGAVLMLAYMNREALTKTLETGYVHYYSRSRGELWRKGETSGHVQRLIGISYDCDEDALLLAIDQTGAACHTDNRSCFYRGLYGEPSAGGVLSELYNVITDRRANPKDGSYTNYLFNKGLDKILKKVGEETAEVIIGAKNRNKDELVYEISDLIYHLTVLMAESDVKWEDVLAELKGRSAKGKDNG